MQVLRFFSLPSWLLTPSPFPFHFSVSLCLSVFSDFRKSILSVLDRREDSFLASYHAFGRTTKRSEHVCTGSCGPPLTSVLLEDKGGLACSLPIRVGFISSKNVTTGNCEFFSPPCCSFSMREMLKKQTESECEPKKNDVVALSPPPLLRGLEGSKCWHMCCVLVPT